MGSDEGQRGARVLTGKVGLSAVVAAIVGTMALTGLTSAAAAPPTRGATKTELTFYNGRWGRQLVVEIEGQKLSLYSFSKDDGKSACYGRCQKVWYPLHSHGEIVVINDSCHVSSECRIDTKQLATVKRKDGSLQITYWGRPLYRYHSDTKTGEHANVLKCPGYGTHQFGGHWGLVGVSGSDLVNASC